MSAESKFVFRKWGSVGLGRGRQLLQTGRIWKGAPDRDLPGAPPWERG